MSLSTWNLNVSNLVNFVWTSRGFFVDFLLTEEGFMTIFYVKANGSLKVPRRGREVRWYEEVEKIVLCHFASVLPRGVCI